MELAPFIFIGAVCAIIGASISEDKVTGAILGGLLGPIGLIIVAIMGRNKKDG